jgi:uncharacterized protein YkwD
MNCYNCKKEVGANGESVPAWDNQPFCTQECINKSRCKMCNKLAQGRDRITLQKFPFHKACFKCAGCQKQMTIDDLMALNGHLPVHVACYSKATIPSSKATPGQQSAYQKFLDKANKNFDPTPETPPSTAEKKLLFDETNRYRRAHGVPPVKHSAKAEKIAQAWADHMAKQGAMQHSAPDFRENCGENVFMSTDENADAKQATDNWYNEIKLYKKFGTEDSFAGTGHFTQMVWKDATQVGFGVARNKNGTAVCATFNPMGNMGGQYGACVLPPKK